METEVHDLPIDERVGPARLRTSKACEVCRKRKIKCSGQSPTACDYCRLKRLHCVYRPRARTRRVRGDPVLSQPRATVESSSHGSSDDLNVETVYTGVSATYSDSPSRTLQLYYGPSSNFPMIQHIHQRLGGNGEEETEEVDEGLERFQYRGIFFGKHSDTQEMSYVGGTTSALAQRAQGKGVDAANLLFLPYNLAADFLNRFLTTLQKHMPFIEPAAAEELLAVLYGNVEVRGLDIGEKAILLAVLAIGATLTEYTVWAETLYKRARGMADELDDVVNVQVCQLGLLLAHFQSISGRPNSVYLLLGTAIRKAFAAGLHKEALSKGRQSVNFALVQERRLTFWSIYIFEVTISFGLGRPISINDSDISIPYPEDQPFFLSLVALSRIFSRASSQLYGSKQGSLFGLYKVAMALKGELDAFRASLPPELSLGPDAEFVAGTQGVQTLFLSNWYYHALILIFRPFLIFHAQWQKDHRLSVSDNVQRVEVSRRQLRDRAPWIFGACDTCVRAARELLTCVAKAMDANELVRRLAYACFYIESGAFLLIFNMLREHNGDDEDARVVRMAIQALERMYDTQPRNISSFAIRRMLALVEGTGAEDVKSTTSPESLATARTPGVIETMTPSAHPTTVFTTMPMQQQQPEFDAGFGVERPVDFEIGDMKLNFDLGAMDLDCWLAMDGFGGVGEVG